MSTGAFSDVAEISIGRSPQRPTPPTPEQLLAERFARGEVDQRDYHQRLDTLRDRSRPAVKP